MPTISVSTDAFSHSQIKSKKWLAENLNTWASKYFSPESSYVLNWYGSWIGVGPMIYLLNANMKIKTLNLYDLNYTDLIRSKYLLDFWRCESIEINYFQEDINLVKTQKTEHQIFINTSCEHISDTQWLDNIPIGNFVVLQATDMLHEEHINCPKDLVHFSQIYENFISILDLKSIEFDYPDKKFSRFMIFGIKK